MTQDFRELAGLLVRYRDLWRDEVAVIDRFEALLARRQDCLLRTCFDPGHITASAWVASPDASRAVLLHHGKLHKWLQPGGHVDGEDRVWLAARREVEEETGLRALTLHRHDGVLVPLDLDVHRIPARKDEPEHEHHDVRFLFVVDPSAAVIRSDESHEVRWIETARIGEFTAEESVLRLLRKARALLR
ncbi:MAG: NUDIX hydrolase [Planctomycetota bacterium]